MSSAAPLRADHRTLRGSWGPMLALGLVLVLAGMLAVSMSVVATLATVMVIGIAALVGAVAEFASGVWARRWEGVLLHLLCGALYAVTGFMMLAHPFKTAEVLTVFMAGLFLAGGVFRVVGSVALRFHNWGWAALGGAVSVLLGVMIWQELPESGLWVIGTFVGIDLLLAGWAWVVLALSLRSLPADG